MRQKALRLYGFRRRRLLTWSACKTGRQEQDSKGRKEGKVVSKPFDTAPIESTEMATPEHVQYVSALGLSLRQRKG